MSHKKLYRFFFNSQYTAFNVHIATGTLEFGQALVMNFLALYDRRGERIQSDLVNVEQYTNHEESIILAIPDGQFFALEMDADVRAFIFMHDAWVRWVATPPLR